MEEFRDEIKEYQREDFDRWSRTNLDDIESNELSMQTNAQVVYFEAGKDMKVSYLFLGLVIETIFVPRTKRLRGNFRLGKYLVE